MTQYHFHSVRRLHFAAASLLLTACATTGGGTAAVNVRPTYLGPISSIHYDGVSDDLLTAGLGKTGLGGATPAFADPERPSAAELRRNAIFYNYRAVLDINPNSGYGTLYGPNVDVNGQPSSGEGKIAGTEYVAYSDDGTGARNVTLLIQVPDTFDPNNACIVSATSSGSRGIYGAIGNAGEWGLKHGCAVAYTDKGTGTGLYTFDDDTVNLQNGLRAPRSVAGKNAIFVPLMSDDARKAFAEAMPNRIAFKHAYSQQNPEQDWGKATLQAIEFAYYVLNQQYGPLSHDGATHTVRLTPHNTIVIASSASNGGGSALLAAEQDDKGLISGVAVSEPQIQPGRNDAYTVMQNGTVATAYGKPLLDYATYAALYQPCVAGNAARCASLVAKGLLEGPDIAAQKSNALAKLRAYGWLADSDPLQALHVAATIPVTVTYVNTYGRFAAQDKVCGFSFAAATDAQGKPIGFTAAQKAASFSNQNGIVGAVVYEDSVGGAKAYALGVSPSTGQADQSLDGFLCLRALATGVDPVSGTALSGAMLAQSRRVREGMAAVQAKGDLHGKPAIIVAGRVDTLVPVNDAARAYVGLNAAVEGRANNLRYIEVTHANHLDGLTSAMPTLIVPLHVYLNRALDALYAHLKEGRPLPQSQVIRTVPRASGAVPVTVANVPPIPGTPAAGDIIGVSGTVVSVPD